MVTSYLDHVSLCNDPVETTETDPVVKKRGILDTREYIGTPIFKAVILATQQSGGTGTVIIYDYDNATELGSIEITSSTPSAYEITLTSVPTDEIVAVELQLKTNGTGNIKVFSATLKVLS